MDKVSIKSHKSQSKTLTKLALAKSLDNIVNKIIQTNPIPNDNADNQSQKSRNMKSLNKIKVPETKNIQNFEFLNDDD